MPRRQFLTSIWVIPVAVLTIVGATLLWVTYDKYQQVHEAEYRLLEAHARYAEVQIGVALHDAGRLLNQIAAERRASLQQPNDRVFARALARHLRDHPEIGTLFVTDGPGRVNYATNPAIMGFDVSRQDYFSAHRDRAYQTVPHVSRPDKTLLGVDAVTLSLPVADAAGNILGMAGATVDYHLFMKALTPVNPADSASVSVIVNRHGDLVYRRFEPQKFFGKNVADASQVFQEHVRADVSVTRHIGPSAHDGKTRLFVTRRVEDTGLSVILSRAQGEVLANWQRNLIIHGLIFLFTAAVILFLAREAQRRQNLLRASAIALGEAKKSAELANAAKSHFLAAASHDLRQPLHALALFVSILKRRHGNESDTDIIKPIEASTLALKEMLDTLLDVSKLDAGVIVPQKLAVSADALFVRLESEFAIQADAKRLKFRIRLSRQYLYTDPTLLMEMLRNLMSNACRYTEEGGILLGCRVRQGMLAIQIWDTGRGIPAEELENIFREYYQVGNPERDRHKGLGLGLSIVDRLAKLLGHGVQVHARVGRGSMFEIVVPLANETPPPGEPPPEDAASAGAALDVLVIDDDPLVLQGMAMLLEIRGHRPIVADSAGEALFKLRGRIPDLIVADYRLRDGQTGIEAIEIIRSNLGIAVPAILVSGDTLPARLREAKSSGLHLLHKPLDPDELDAQIKRLMVKGAG